MIPTALLILEDLYIKDQRAFHQADSLEEVYQVIAQNTRKLLNLIDDVGFIHPQKFGTKASRYFYTLVTHADSYKELQKEYLRWLKQSHLDYLDIYNLQKRIHELKYPQSLSQEDFWKFKKERFGRPVVSMPYFEEYPNIRGFYSTKTLGDLRPRNLDSNTLKKRRRKLKQLVLQNKSVRLLSYTLLNGDNIIELSGLKNKDSFFQDYKYETANSQLLEDYKIEGDAIIVPFKDVKNYKIGGVGTLVADCFVLTLWDKHKTVLAQVRLGVPGFTMGLLEKLLDVLEYKYGVPAKDLYVLWGPGLHKENYIYTDISRFKGDSKWKGFIIPKKHGDATVYQMNLLGAIRHRLLELGVKFDNYLITPVDTYTNPYLFSHARSLRTKEIDERFFVGVKLKQG